MDEKTKQQQQHFLPSHRCSHFEKSSVFAIS